MATETKACRICLSEDNDDEIKEKFISPCKCKGSIKWVHPSCLEKTKTTVCPVCFEKLFPGREFAAYLFAMTVIVGGCLFVGYMCLSMLYSFFVQLHLLYSGDFKCYPRGKSPGYLIDASEDFFGCRDWFENYCGRSFSFCYLFGVICNYILTGIHVCALFSPFAMVLFALLLVFVW